jgi:hypothetical protein
MPFEEYRFWEIFITKMHILGGRLDSAVETEGFGYLAIEGI